MIVSFTLVGSTGRCRRTNACASLLHVTAASATDTAADPVFTTSTVTATTSASPPPRVPAEIARNLGINEGTLANWVNTAKKSGKLKEKPLDTDERARLRELEEENRRLKMERDFLKKAAAWFAKENQ